jgi:hypothetical protein
MVRTDGIAFITIAHETAQTVISNADTGLPLRGIKQIMGSLHHGCAALDSGEVRRWPLAGDATGNNSGQLGNGTVGGSYATLAATLVKTLPVPQEPTRQATPEPAAREVGNACRIPRKVRTQATRRLAPALAFFVAAPLRTRPRSWPLLRAAGASRARVTSGFGARCARLP